MLIEVKKETTEMVEINLPIYFKTDWQYYAWLDETKVITLHMRGDGVGLLIAVGEPDSSDRRKVQVCEKITAEDFDFAYQMALERLTKAVHPQKEAV